MDDLTVQRFLSNATAPLTAEDMARILSGCALLTYVTDGEVCRRILRPDDLV